MSRPRSAIALIGLALAACGYGQPTTSAPSATTAPVPRVTFVTIGSDAASGAAVEDPLHDLWSQRLFSDELPPQAVFVNLATDGATTADALREQVPIALELRPTIVAIWLIDAPDSDAALGARSADLTRMIEDLTAAGATVLVARGGPPDAVTDQVVASAGGTPVELGAISGLVPGSVAEQEAIAAAFTSSLRAAVTETDRSDVAGR